MTMNTVCSNVSAVRLLNQTRLIKHAKWRIFPCSSLSWPKEELKCVCSGKMLSRIICTESKFMEPLPSETLCEQEKIFEPVSIYYQESFLRENFNIIDNRYLKLITLPNESHYLEEMLCSMEFKDVLNRSPFLYDVNLAEHSKKYLLPSENNHAYNSNEIFSTSNDFCSSKQSPQSMDRLSSPVSDSGMEEQNTNKPSEEQLLYVINRLTTSLLRFFEKPQDYTIYHKNIIFQNNIKGVTTKGLIAYMQNMYLLKLYGYLQYAKVKVEILKITHHIEDGSIRVRWRVKGVTRQKVFIMLWKYKSLSWAQLIEEEAEWLDGFSVFNVGPDGLIFKHVCDKMMPDDNLTIRKQSDIKNRLLGLLGLAPRGPTAGTLNSLIPYCRSSQEILSAKKMS